MKKILCLLVLAIFSITCTGCSIFDLNFNAFSNTNNQSNVDTTTTEQYTFTDRQIEILEEEGLPTDYNELTLSQKVSIEAIEDIFSYLDKKYPDDTFTYSGYVSGDNMNNEHLIVNSLYGEVEVYRDISGAEKKYEDNYNEVKASSLYSEVINDYVSTLISNDKFAVSANVNECKSDTWNKKNLLSICRAGCILYIKESVGKEKFEYVIKKLSKYIKENAKNNSVSIDFYLVKNKKFKIDSFFYENSITDNMYIERKTYDLSNGKEKYY
jgi:hypothetical protein